MKQATALPHPTYQAEFYQDVPMKRLIAWGIDTVLIFVLSILLAVMTLGIAFFAFFGLFFLVGFAYRVATLANGSATLGMRLMAIELRDSHGDRFDLGTAFLHTLGYSISWAIFPIQLLSMVLMVTTVQKQGLTDLILSTVALNRAA